MALGIFTKMRSFTQRTAGMAWRSFTCFKNVLVLVFGDTMATPQATGKLLLLIPFALAVCFCLMTFQPTPQTTSDTRIAALTKAAPTLYLAFYVWFQGRQVHPREDPSRRLKKNQFVVATVISLVLSSLGDMCLVVDDFFWGTVLFGMAHTACIYGLYSTMPRNQRARAFKVPSLTFALRKIASYLPGIGADPREGRRVCEHAKKIFGSLVLVFVFGVTPVCIQVYVLTLLLHAVFQGLSYLMVSNQSDKTLQVIIDPDERQKILRYIHEGDDADLEPRFRNRHFGQDKTEVRLLDRFWWPGIRGDVRTFVNSCMHCQWHKPDKKNQKGNFSPETKPDTRPMSAPKNPWEQIGIEICHMPKSREGFSFLAVVIDYFSVWIEAEPLAAKTPENVANFLYRLLCRHGCAEHIHVIDSDKEFTRRVSDHLLFLVGVKQNMSNASHSMDIEPFRTYSQMIQDLLMKVLNNPSDVDDWPKALQGVLFTFRTSALRSGFSPFFLLYGRQPKLPVSIETIDDEHGNKEQDVEGYVTSMSGSNQHSETGRRGKKRKLKKSDMSMNMEDSGVDMNVVDCGPGASVENCSARMKVELDVNSPECDLIMKVEDIGPDEDVENSDPEVELDSSCNSQL